METWFSILWGTAVLTILLWIGYTLSDIAGRIYTGPSSDDDHGKALDKIQKSIDDMHKSLLKITR